MRLASNMWIASFFKRMRAKGGFCAVLHGGDEQAGAIFVVERGPQGISCWAPVPQAMVSDQDEGNERLFECVANNCDEQAVTDFVKRQVDFDRDCHIVEVEGCAADLPTPAADRKQQIRDDLNDRFGHVFRR